MYKYLLVALNAKYIHSNLGIYSIEAYLKERNPNLFVEKLESNINHNMDIILQDIYEQHADAVGFSTYIWNIEYVLNIAKNLRKLQPNVRIILGGPEVTYKARQLMEENPWIDFIIKGEGEKISSKLLEVLQREDECFGHQCRENPSKENQNKEYQGKECQSKGDPNKEYENTYRRRFDKSEKMDLPGICYRMDDIIYENKASPPMDMDELPFVYPKLGKEFMENRIYYYESSRGCPFRCSYCLSSIGSDLKFRNIDLVKKELQYFLDNQVQQVKFVDRTFNAKKSHSLEILKYMKEHDNGITNFHFEIEGDILSEEELTLLSTMRAGHVQLEIGVQTTNDRTLREIRRFANTSKLEENMRRLRAARNIHLHLDLIAGLPYEDFASFQNSFNRVYAMRPDELQLGFLKVLDGSYMWEMEKEYGIIRFDTSPYEILSNHWLSYPELLRLKAVEEVLEVYFNSRQFEESMEFLESTFASAYAMYEYIGEYYNCRKLFHLKHNRIKRYEILYDCMYEWKETGALDEAEWVRWKDRLMLDIYKREKVKSRPYFCLEDRGMEKEYKEVFRKECIKRGLKNHEAHLEVLSDGRMVFFDYRKRNPISSNVEMVFLPTSEK